jgi:hypothetical protein
MGDRQSMTNLIFITTIMFILGAQAEPPHPELFFHSKIKSSKKYIFLGFPVSDFYHDLYTFQHIALLIV